MVIQRREIVVTLLLVTLAVEHLEEKSSGCEALVSTNGPGVIFRDTERSSRKSEMKPMTLTRGVVFTKMKLRGGSGGVVPKAYGRRSSLDSQHVMHVSRILTPHL